MVTLIFFIVVIILFYYCRFYLFCTTISSKLHQHPISSRLTLSGTLKHHIIQTRGKCEASLQAIMSIAKHRHIREKEMFTIMKLHETCTMPMLLYGIEGLIPTNMERKELDDINTNIMRRIINTPPTTSKELIMMETDQVPVDTKIDERQIIYHMKKLNANKTQSLRETIDNDPWNKKLKIAMETYNITEENLAGKSNNQMKQPSKQCRRRFHRI